MKLNAILIATLLFSLFSCQAQESAQNKISVNKVVETPMLRTGAEMLMQDLSILDNKNVALVVNPTSMIKNQHLLDALIDKGVAVKKIFAPEHGFRGTADAGEKIIDGIDSKSGLPVISLYGNHKKPTKEDLEGLDLIIFDIQDVGVRFYTYISTLHYVMEACAENNVELLVLDRPNPNGNRIDGNVLYMDYSSFVGMHPVPVLHGMTIGEYALMINGEGWIENGIKCQLTVLKCHGYTHDMPYSLPVKPSPNLPNDRAIFLYPSTCFFEGTIISEGRGTPFPFQVFGAPEIDKNIVPYAFTPKSMEGAKYPKFENKTCYGYNISEPIDNFEEQKGINLTYLISMYNLYPDKENFFLKNGFFDKLAGGTALRKAIINGLTEEEIKATWQEDIEEFKEMRKQYLLYPDFEE